MGSNADLGSTFASAGVDTMTAYDEILVTRLFGFRAGPWGLLEADELSRLFEAAGFGDVVVTRSALPVVFAGGAAQLVATLAAAPVGPEVAALDAEGRAALLAAAEASVAPFEQHGGVYSEAATHIVVAAP